MKLLTAIALSAFLLTGLSACGSRGSLKTPTQIKEQDEKKARRDAKEAQRAAKRDAADRERQSKFPQALPPLESEEPNQPITPSPAGSE